MRWQGFVQTFHIHQYSDYSIFRPILFLILERLVAVLSDTPRFPVLQVGSFDSLKFLHCSQILAERVAAGDRAFTSFLFQHRRNFDVFFRNLTFKSRGWCRPSRYRLVHLAGRKRQRRSCNFGCGGEGGSGSFISDHPWTSCLIENAFTSGQGKDTRIMFAQTTGIILFWLI